jgi:ribosomal protein S18 acetylase RimI-like enzyme
VLLADAAVLSSQSMERESMQIVDLRTRRDERLLDELYRELYLPAFPIREEQEDPSVWAPALWGQDSGGSRLHFLVAGENLDEPEARQLIGFVACEYYPQSRCGLVSYMAVSPASRHHGLGRRLLETARHTLQVDADEALACLFGEVNDPDKVAPEQDSMPPRTRLKIMEKLGARRVPVPYVQPELRPGKGRSYTLMLVAFPPDRGELAAIPSQVVRAFLGELYRELGVEPLDSDPDFSAMMLSLEGDAVTLEPLR